MEEQHCDELYFNLKISTQDWKHQFLTEAEVMANLGCCKEREDPYNLIPLDKDKPKVLS